MFVEGSAPIEVAIALNLRENQVSEYYREYWILNGMYHLNQIYEEIKYGIWPVIELHRRMNTEGLSPQQVSRILKKIITLERQNMDLEGEQARLELSNKKAAQTFQLLTDSIQEDHKTVEENYYIISQQRREIENLNIENARLENIINSIPLNNETCVKVKQIAKQEIENGVSNPRRLLRLALVSLLESSRKHPGKFQALYYNMPSHLSVEQILLQSSINHNTSQNRYSENENVKLLLDEAEQSYNKIIDAITNNCINEIPKDTESLLQILQVPDVQDGLSSVCDNHEILDTGDLSQVNFVYNDITFRVYPDPKILNERRRGTDVR
jgi:DNA polymerase III delta prime subunit